MTPDEYLLVYISCPPEAAEALARQLVEQRLAACVNLLDGVRSIYRWRDDVEQAAETLLLAKTRGSRYAQLQQAVRDAHPYELPEIVAVPIASGLPDYLHWIAESTT